VGIGAGPPRLLGGLYVLFAVAATARSAYQIAAHFGDAPLAYLLSAAAAVVYVVAAAALRTGRGRLLAVAAGIELAGVVLIGALSLVDAHAFPDDTVWSRFGQGYGFVPLVLPVLALGWLVTERRTRRA
jgi:hypothetical protein